jgi:hypothetical protein
MLLHDVKNTLVLDAKVLLRSVLLSKQFVPLSGLADGSCKTGDRTDPSLLHPLRKLIRFIRDLIGVKAPFISAATLLILGIVALHSGIVSSFSLGLLGSFSLNRFGADDDLRMERPPKATSMISLNSGSFSIISIRLVSLSTLGLSSSNDLLRTTWPFSLISK